MGYLEIDDTKFKKTLGRPCGKPLGTTIDKFCRDSLFRDRIYPEQSEGSHQTGTKPCVTDPSAAPQDRFCRESRQNLSSAGWSQMQAYYGAEEVEVAFMKRSIAKICSIRYNKSFSSRPSEGYNTQPV